MVFIVFSRRLSNLRSTQVLEPMNLFFMADSIKIFLRLRLGSASNIDLISLQSYLEKMPASIPSSRQAPTPSATTRRSDWATQASSPPVFLLARSGIFLTAYLKLGYSFFESKGAKIPNVPFIIVFAILFSNISYF